MSTTPDIAQQRAYYDTRWATAAYANSLQLRRTIAILEGLHRLGLRQPRILDLGCGTGWLSAILSAFGPTTAVDLSPVAINAAQARYPDVHFVATDLFDLATTGWTFDLVVSQEILEHVEDQARFVALSASLLRPGGGLLLTTPNAWNLAHWTREALEEWGLQPIEQWVTTRGLRRLLEPHFRIVTLRTFILGHGTRGIFRVVNSPRLSTLLAALSFSSARDHLLERAGFGLHIIAVGTRR